jgi:hypothetical protein
MAAAMPMPVATFTNGKEAACSRTLNFTPYERFIVWRFQVVIRHRAAQRCYDHDQCYDLASVH